MKAGVLAGAALLLISASLAADVKDTEEFTFDVNKGARISLENLNGDIRITGSSGDRVEVLAHKKADEQEYLDELKVIVDADENYIRIETRHPKSEGSWFHWGGDGGGSVTYELNVPRHVDLDAITTVNGDITISGVGGLVKTETVNGSLEAEGLMADASLETVNGSIKAAFEVLGAGQRVSADTVNGKIVLRIPSDASARVNAETVNGSIDANDFGLEPEKGFVGRELSADIGGGDARLTLDTVNGSVTLRTN